MVSDRPGPWTVGYSSLRILIEGTDWRVNCSKRHSLHFVWQRESFCAWFAWSFAPAMRYFVGFYFLPLQSIQMNFIDADCILSDSGNHSAAMQRHLRLIRLKFSSCHEVLCWLLFLSTPINNDEFYRCRFFRQHNLWIWEGNIKWLGWIDVLELFYYLVFSLRFYFFRCRIFQIIGYWLSWSIYLEDLNIWLIKFRRYLKTQRFSIN